MKCVSSYLELTLRKRDGWEIGWWDPQEGIEQSLSSPPRIEAESE